MLRGGLALPPGSRPGPVPAFSVSDGQTSTSARYTFRARTGRWSVVILAVTPSGTPKTAEYPCPSRTGSVWNVGRHPFLKAA